MRLFLIVTCLAITSCVAPTTSDMIVTSDAAYIRGPITQMTDRGILVEENPNESSGSNKAFLRLTADTQIGSADGRALTRNELRVGQRVAVWVTGEVRESYPVQATARRIMVEAATPR